MRFSTLVAFTLPFSALAAPVLIQRQSALDLARQQVVEGLTNAGTALDTTLAQATAIEHPPQQAVIDDTIKAQADIALASAAVERIGNAIVAAQVPNEADQLQVAQGILDAQSIVDQLEGKIVNNIGKHGDDGGDDDGMGMGTGKGKGRRSKGKKLTMALNDLRTSIGQARDGAALALQGGLGVLAAQGKSIRGLFENAGLDVPPGF